MRKGKGISKKIKVDDNPLFNVYKGLEEQIKSIKEICSSNFKTEMKKLGFRLVAEWIDWEFPVLFNDVYLLEYENYLYRASFSAGTKNVYLNDRAFQKFSTIRVDKIRQKSKTLMGYKINPDNSIVRAENKNIILSVKNLVYRDLMRIEKISKLLEMDKSVNKD